MLIIKNLVALSVMFFLAVGQLCAQGIQYTAPQSVSPIVIQDSLISDTANSVVKRSGRWSHLTIISDSRIDTLLQIHKEENERLRGMRGYRLQIFTGSHQNAVNIESRFIVGNPNVRAYREFDTPDWVVRIGDFRTKSEAIKLKNKLSNSYKSILIIDDVINFPDLPSLSSEND